MSEVSVPTGVKTSVIIDKNDYLSFKAWQEDLKRKSIGTSQATEVDSPGLAKAKKSVRIRLPTDEEDQEEEPERRMVDLVPILVLEVVVMQILAMLGAGLYSNVFSINYGLALVRTILVLATLSQLVLFMMLFFHLVSRLLRRI